MASGKTTLVAKLQGVEEYMKGRGLEYLYFNVHDEDVDGENSDTYLAHHGFYRRQPYAVAKDLDFSDRMWPCVAA